MTKVKKYHESGRVKNLYTEGKYIVQKITFGKNHKEGKKYLY